MYYDVSPATKHPDRRLKTAGRVEIKVGTEQGWRIALDGEGNMSCSLHARLKNIPTCGRVSRAWSAADCPRKALPESANGRAIRVGTRISIVPVIPQIEYPNFGHLGTRFEELPVFWSVWVLDWDVI
jgi:hypothetical protein